MPRPLLATPPWRRAPLLLLRHPGTALAVAGAALVVAFVAASWPLFLGSVVDASQRRQVSQRCPWEIGATVTPTAEVTSPAVPARPAALAALGEAVAAAGEGSPRLGEPVRTTSALVQVVPARGSPRAARLVARTGAFDEVAVVAGAPPLGRGVLLPSSTAAELGVAPGTSVELRAGAAVADVAVAGTYQPLADPLPAYWCSEVRSLVPAGYGGDPPPPVLLVDEPALEEVAGALALPLEVRWELPVEGSPGVSEAAELVRRIDGLEDDIEDRAVDDAVVAGGPLGAGPVGAVRGVTSTLPFIVRQSDVVADGLESGLAPTVVGAAVAGAALLLATGWFWSERRSGELGLLRRLGIGPVSIGAKGVLELLAPVAAGAAVGLVLAVGVVATVGPGGVPDGRAIWRGAAWVAGAGAAGLVGAGVVAGARSAAADRAGGSTTAGTAASRARSLLAVPWELAVLVLAMVLVGGRRTSLSVGEGRLDLDAVSFLVPVAVLGAAGVLVSRILHAALRVGSRRGRSLPTAAWLGLRRLSRRPGAPALFTACVATSIGVLVYANGASSSLQRSLDDKATLAVGADALIRTVGTEPLPPDAGRVSVVRYVTGPQRSTPLVTLLGVDPRTAADVVRFPGTSRDRLAELLEAIDVPGSGPVPALLVGGPAPDGGVVELAGRGTQPVQLDVVARLDAFPGMSQSGPTVVLALDRLTAIGVPYTESVWVRGDPAPVVERLTSAGIDVRSVRRPDQALDTATFLAVVWTFGFVRALAVLGGTVSAVGLLVYLDARQRSRQLAYGLSRHMGLSRSTHRRSIGLELVVMVVPATACGVLAGIAVSTVFVPRLDPLPRFEPGTDAVVARPVVAAAVAVAGVLCLVGAQIGQRAADRVRLSAALRHGG